MPCHLFAALRICLLRRQQCKLEICDSTSARLTTLGRASSTRVLIHSTEDAQIQDVFSGTVQWPALQAHTTLHPRGTLCAYCARGAAADTCTAPAGQSVMLHDGDQLCLLPSHPEELLILSMSAGGKSIRLQDTEDDTGYSYHV